MVINPKVWGQEDIPLKYGAQRVGNARTRLCSNGVITVSDNSFILVCIRYSEDIITENVMTVLRNGFNLLPVFPVPNMKN